MNLGFILLVNVAMASLAALIVQCVMSRYTDRLWIVVHSVIFGSAAAAYLYRWDDAGYMLAAIFLIAVIAPVALMNIGGKLSAAGRASAAARACGIAAFLHPVQHWRFHARIMSATATPLMEEQCAALERLEHDAPAGFSEMAHLYRLRLLSAWDELLAMPVPTGAARIAVPLHSVFRIMALGQTGRLDEMASWFLASRKELEWAHMYDEALLSVLVLSGKYQQVESLLALPGFQGWDMSYETRQWAAWFSRLIAGQKEALPVLQALAEKTSDPLFRVRMKRIEDPLPDSRKMAHEFSERIEWEAATRLTQSTMPMERRFTPAVLLLLTANIAGYIYQMLTGDPESAAAVAAAGGMWPPYVREGEWWRLATALFLHFGWLRLSFNMIALYYIGGDAERRLGSWQTLLIYLLGGLLSSIFVFWLMIEEYAMPAVLAGASGSVLALMGALLAICLADWRNSRSQRDRPMLVAIGIVAALSFVSDFMIPNVSFAAHFGGFVAGLVLGVIFILFRR